MGIIFSLAILVSLQGGRLSITGDWASEQTMGFTESILFDSQRMGKNNGISNKRLLGETPYQTETGHCSDPVGGRYASGDH